MALSVEAFDCAVCANVLLDPVVGPCGHDFCKECLEGWRQATCARGRRGCACPICRKPLPNELGVCLRLRETIQALFPDKLKERRAEMEERRAAAAAAAVATAAAAAIAPAAASSNRRQASSVPGVHRSNIPWAGSSSFGAGSSSFGAGSSNFGAGSSSAYSFGSPFGPAFFGAVAMPTGGPSSAQAAVTAAATTTAAPTLAPAVDTWTYSGALCFSLGWHDPNENRGRRSWGRRRRAVAV